MSNIKGIYGQEFISGVSELIVVWKDGTVHRKNSAWARGAGINLTLGKDAYMSSLINKVLLTNYTDNNWIYDGNSWTQLTDIIDSPVAQFNASHSNRWFLYKIKIQGVEYPSRFWFSDLPNNRTITWGFEFGTDLTQVPDSTSGTTTVTSVSAAFVSRNIKAGDPFFVTTGTNARNKPYTVRSVDSEIQITLVEVLANSTTGSSYWVGGNWVDVETDDGDIGMGMGTTANEVIFFKKKSVHRYNISGTDLKRIKNAIGTTSSRSIISKGGYVYWYHPSGIYRTDGGNAQLISKPIEDVVTGMTDANKSLVIGWKNEALDTVCMYLGDVTLRDGTSISKCVATFDDNTESWSLRSYPVDIRVATDFLESDVYKVYAVADSDKVYQFDTGTNFDDADIPCELTLNAIFPAGSEAIVDMSRLRAYVENGPDVQILFRLVYKPMEKNNAWVIDEDWTAMIGNQFGDRSEWRFPAGARASGVILKVVESSGDESFFGTKLVLYYSNESNY